MWLSQDIMRMSENGGFSPEMAIGWGKSWLVSQFLAACIFPRWGIPMPSALYLDLTTSTNPNQSNMV